MALVNDFSIVVYVKFCVNVIIGFDESLYILLNIKITLGLVKDRDEIIVIPFLVNCFLLNIFHVA